MAQKATGRPRPTTSRLEIGEHSIDRVEPKEHDDGTWWLTWTIRLTDGRTRRPRTKGRTKTEARRRAKDKAKELLAASRSDIWKVTDDLVSYMEKVSKPAIETAKLATNSRDRYLLVYKLIVGGCLREDHKHSRSLKGHTIGTGTRFRALERCLVEIAELHGSETAHQARSVLGKYVLDQLIRDELIDASPIAGKRLDLAGSKGDTPTRGGVALSADEWNAVIDYLLALDPAEGIEPPKRGMYTLEDRIAVAANAIDLTLLQTMTGLRIGEATNVDPSMVTFDGDEMIFDLPPEITKTKKGRFVHVTDPAIVARFKPRWEIARAKGGPLIPSPAKPGVVWDQRQRNEAVKTLYLKMAEELDIPALETERSHVWRATLNTLTLGAGVPEAIRTAHLGHTAQVNRRSYTDTRDGAVLARKLSGLRTSKSTPKSTQSESSPVSPDEPS
ncbi:integrase [Kribbella aluminosa]|uniref:Integrase n=1 Tax=Kribbella aluminosa TaxID=416017 RepID=A0ABS4UC21_9ACTN|nr:site-specific integrase [Kribbella aluminosa]MBP2349175.1 integrase [Kribbella aluminosa]